MVATSGHAIPAFSFVKMMEVFLTAAFFKLGQGRRQFEKIVGYFVIGHHTQLRKFGFFDLNRIHRGAFRFRGNVDFVF